MPRYSYAYASQRELYVNVDNRFLNTAEWRRAGREYLARKNVQALTLKLSSFVNSVRNRFVTASDGNVIRTKVNVGSVAFDV